MDYLTELAGVVDSPANAVYFAGMVRETAVAREVIHAAVAAMNTAYTAPGDALPALQQASESIEVGGVNVDGQIADGITDAVDRLCTKIDPEKGEHGVLTLRVPALRKVLVRPGNFVVIAGTVAAATTTTQNRQIHNYHNNNHYYITQHTNQIIIYHYTQTTKTYIYNQTTTIPITDPQLLTKITRTITK